MDYYYGVAENEISDEIENEYLTPKEVMELLYIGRSTFYKLIQSGELPGFKVGKQWRVSRAAIAAFVGAH